MRLDTHDRRVAMRRLEKIVADLAAGKLVAEAEEVRPKIAKVGESVSHLRRLLVRFFGDLSAAEHIAINIAREVPLPEHITKDLRMRTIPTDEEIATFLASPAADLECEMLALSARVVGGMRTVELVRWRWEDVPDRETFATCTIPTATGAAPQALEVPELLRPFLAARWEAMGRPVAGPIFPVERGPRKGEAKNQNGVSFADRLRRAFVAAGVDRHELHNDTPRTRRMDFHSMRRAFASALARVGVNAQAAMALTGHTDPRTHNRYLVGQITAVPVAALPAVNHNTVASRPSSEPWTNQPSPAMNRLVFPSGKRDSNPRHSAWEADALPTELFPRTRAPP